MKNLAKERRIEVLKKFYSKENYPDSVEFFIPNINRNFYYSQMEFSKYCEVVINQKLGDILNLESTNAIIAGGSILDLLITRNPTYISDFDLFFSEKEELDKTFNHLTSLGTGDFFETKYAYSFTFGRVKVQLIRELAKDLSRFDFTCCKIGYNLSKKEVVLEDLLEKMFCFFLTINNTVNKDNALMFLKRAFKLKEKGYSLNKGELLKILLSISKNYDNSAESADALFLKTLGSQSNEEYKF